MARTLRFSGPHPASAILSFQSRKASVSELALEGRRVSEGDTTPAEGKMRSHDGRQSTSASGLPQIPRPHDTSGGDKLLGDNLNTRVQRDLGLERTSSARKGGLEDPFVVEPSLDWVRVPSVQIGNLQIGSQDVLKLPRPGWGGPKGDWQPQGRACAFGDASTPEHDPKGTERP